VHPSRVNCVVQQGEHSAVSGTKYCTILRTNLINIAHLDVTCCSRGALNPIEERAARLSASIGLRRAPMRCFATARAGFFNQLIKPQRSQCLTFVFGVKIKDS
jgi:hypothetical protein